MRLKFTILLISLPDSYPDPIYPDQPFECKADAAMPHWPVVSWARLHRKTFLSEFGSGGLVNVKLVNIKLQVRRSYTMVARAEAAAATAERILDAAVEVFWELPTDKISLDEVGRRAGVTVQTVIRRFGGRDGLLAAGVERESEKVRRRRNVAVPGDTAGAVRILIEDYEVTGDPVMKMLAEEWRIPGLRAIVDGGREFHRAWCARVFAPALARLRGLKRERRLAQFVAVCDVYTWKLLRRDAGLSRRQTELAMVELLNPLLEGS